MLSLVILLLSSGCVILCSQYEQGYVLINTSMTWNDAQTYCRENHIDLATIRNRDDMTKLAKTPSDEVSSAWIGLKKNGVASWQWSVGETQTSDGLVNYTNWASSPNSSHDCGGMRDDGKWLSAPCGNLNPFVCQRDEGSSEMHVVLEAMSWRKARVHCELNYGDLVSVMNVIENQAVQQIAGNPPPTFFWIGVFKDEWEWSDGSYSSYRHWENSQPNNDGICTLYYPSSKTMWDRGCTSAFPFFCSTASFVQPSVLVRRQIVSVKMRSNLIVDFSGSAVTKAILSQIQNRNGRLQLQWVVQPDGEIFHKEDKTKVIEAC